MVGTKLAPIESGTVIDHIGPYDSLQVLNNLGIRKGYSGTVSLLMNVQSKKLTWKDVIKIESQKLTIDKIYKIAVVAPYATISFIENFSVTNKIHAEKLEEIMLACSNMDCESNASVIDHLTPTFVRQPDGTYSCKYCKKPQSYIL